MLELMEFRGISPRDNDTPLVTLTDEKPVPAVKLQEAEAQLVVLEVSPLSETPLPESPQGELGGIVLPGEGSPPEGPIGGAGGAPAGQQTPINGNPQQDQALGPAPRGGNGSRPDAPVRATSAPIEPQIPINPIGDPTPELPVALAKTPIAPEPEGAGQTTTATAGGAGSAGGSPGRTQQEIFGAINQLTMQSLQLVQERNQNEAKMKDLQAEQAGFPEKLDDLGRRFIKLERAQGQLKQQQDQAQMMNDQRGLSLYNSVC